MINCDEAQLIEDFLLNNDNALNDADTPGMTAIPISLMWNYLNYLHVPFDGTADAKLEVVYQLGDKRLLLRADITSVEVPKPSELLPF